MNKKSTFDDRFSDLLEGQDDTALRNLLQDLDALYAVERHPAQFVPPPVRLVPPQDAATSPLGTFAEHPRPMRRRWSRMNALAAILFTVLLISVLAGTSYALWHTTPAPQASTPTVGINPTTGTTATIGATPTPGVILGPRACPASVAAPAHWEAIIQPYAYGGSHHVELVSCANIMGNPSLQALITVRRVDHGHTLDVFIFSNITDAHPTKIFQIMGLVQGSAKISGYSTLMTAEADQISSVNMGKDVSTMTADLFREFKWSASTKTLVQTVFPGLFPDLTRYQAETSQVQVNQGHQAWRLSATQVATALAVNLLQWSPQSTSKLLSGGDVNDVNAVVQVRSTEQPGGSITVTLSRLEGKTNGSIWEVIAVSSSGLSITSPAARSRITSPVQVTGAGPAFEAVIGSIKVLDHLYQPIGQTTATGAIGMGQTTFSNSLDYQTSFPAGTQEGLLVLLVTSNANGSLASAVMEKVLIGGLPGTA